MASKLLSVLKGLGDVIGYLVDLLVLFDFLTRRDLLSVLSGYVGNIAIYLYDVIVILCLAAAVTVPFYVGTKYKDWKGAKKLTKPTSKPTGTEMEAFDASELVAKYPWTKLLPDAKQDIVIFAVACESISHYGDLLRQLLETNKDLTITCAFMEPYVTKTAEREEGWTGATASASASLKRLETAKEQMGESERNRFAIEAYEGPVPFNMVVLDHQTENAYMQVGYYPRGIDQTHRITNVFRKKGRETLFRKYWNEYKAFCDEWACSHY